MITRVSKSRIIALHKAIAAIGRQVGDTAAIRRCSTRRLAWRESESAAHSALVDALRPIPGAKWWADPIGNTFIDFPGTDHRLSPIVVGSHLDTVYYPGLFDGVSGCVAGAAIAWALHSPRISLRHPYRVAIWRAEESTRFKKAMLGSKWFAEQITTRELLSLVDDSGISVEVAMRDLGIRPDQITRDAKKLNRKIAAYLELHIEQGNVLESLGAPVGVVNCFKGTKRAIIKVHGIPTHTGTGIMRGRKDPVPAAGEMVAAVREIALAVNDDQLVASTGLFKSDGSMNQTAKTAMFTLDIRDLNPKRLVQVSARILKACADIAKQRGVTLKVQDLGLTPPIASSKVAQKAITDSAMALGLDAPIISSGAGHDAVSFLLRGNAVSFRQRGDYACMVLVRSSSRTSSGSYSHDWTEFADYGDLTLGTELMLDSVIRLDAQLN